MRTIAPLLAIALMATACGSLQTTTQVRDDVYDIPERNAPVLAGNGEPAPSANGLPEGFVEDYYDPNDSGNYDLGYANERSYQDIAYNDPQYYNYDRFGFNVGVNTWGPSYGMGMSYGWPGYGDPWGNPYWNNSFMSGYGAWGSPAYGPGWNMGVSMFWGQPFGGFPPYYGGAYPLGGYNPFGMPCCYGCGDFYGTTGVYQHRPTLGGGSGNTGSTVVAPVPVQYRPNTLMRTRPSTTNAVREATRTVNERSRTMQSTDRSKGQRMEGTRGGGGQERTAPSGGSRSGGSMGGGSTGGGGGSRPSTGGGRR